LEVAAVPIYEYQCSKCGEIFEAFQKITDLPLTECRFCHGKVEKLFSHTSFQLKGSGWYLTDYARKSQPSGASSPAADGSKAKDKTGSSADKSGSTSSKPDKSTT
jgi:putative FmdB family regulatory protein